MQVNVSSRATASVHLTAAISQLAGAGCRIVGVVPPDEALDGLLDGPTMMSTSASYLGELVLAARRRGLAGNDFRLRRIDVGGEILSPTLAAAATETFGARVNDGFGMTEVIPVTATTCSQGHLHHDINMGLVELLDLDSGEPAAPGALSTVVITPYYPYRECMPVFRYDTRDVVRRLPDEPLTCEIAGLPAVSQIVGKADQIIRLGNSAVITPERRRRGGRGAAVTAVARSVPHQGSAGRGWFSRCRSALSPASASGPPAGTSPTADSTSSSNSSMTTSRPTFGMSAVIFGKPPSFPHQSPSEDAMLPGESLLFHTMVQLIVAITGTVITCLLALAYLTRVRLERPAIGTFNGRDIAVLFVFIVGLPLLYLMLPLLPLLIFLGITFASALSMGLRPLLGPSVTWLVGGSADRDEHLADPDHAGDCRRAGRSGGWSTA